MYKRSLSELDLHVMLMLLPNLTQKTMWRLSVWWLGFASMVNAQAAVVDGQPHPASDVQDVAGVEPIEELCCCHAKLLSWVRVFTQ